MSKLRVEAVGNMSPSEEGQFWNDFVREMANDDGAAAGAHLAAGRPIHYCDDRYPEGVVRRWPDGREELVKVDFTAGGAVTVIRAL